MKKRDEFSEKTWEAARELLYKTYPFNPAENPNLLKVYIAARAYEAGVAATKT